MINYHAQGYLQKKNFILTYGYRKLESIIASKANMASGVGCWAISSWSASTEQVMKQRQGDVDTETERDYWLLVLGFKTSLQESIFPASPHFLNFPK